MEKIILNSFTYLLKPNIIDVGLLCRRSSMRRRSEIQQDLHLKPSRNDPVSSKSRPAARPLPSTWNMHSLLCWCLTIPRTYSLGPSSKMHVQAGPGAQISLQGKWTHNELGWVHGACFISFAAGLQACLQLYQVKAQAHWCFPKR